MEFRLFRDEDRPALERLWEQETEWGSLTPELWQRLYEANPNGPAMVVVATENGVDGIVGQMAFVASRVSVSGRIVQAYRPFAPIVVKKLRMFRSPELHDHPMARIYMHSAALVKERGAGLIYTLPDRKFQRMVKMMRYMQAGSFELWSMALPMPEPFRADSGCGVPIGISSDIVERLWRQASGMHRAIVVRDALAFPWRANKDESLAVRRGDEVIGMACYRLEG